MKFEDYYALLACSSKMSARQVIDVLTSQFILSHKWSINRCDTILYYTRTMFERIIRPDIDNLSDEPIFCDDGHDYDDNGDCIKKLDYDNTFIPTSRFVTVSVENGFSLPSEFLKAYGYEQQPESRCAAETETVLPAEADEVLPQVAEMPLPILKKKVSELTKEKLKWDKSIAIAAKVGLLFYEKGLVKPATKAAFKAEYAKWFEPLPETTVSKIYKSLPEKYRNLGERPAEQAVPLIDDDVVDALIEASVTAGFLTRAEGKMSAAELKGRLQLDGCDALPMTYINAISKYSKKVAKEYEPVSSY